MKTDRKKAKRGKVLQYFDNLSAGQSFYTDMLPKGLTAYASIYGKQITTEILLCISPKTLKVEKVTKCTIL